MEEIINESNFWKENIVKIIGIGIAILTFITERVITYLREKRTTKYNWFLKVIVEPHLDLINEFYKTTDRELKNACEDLKSQESLNDLDYIVLKRSYCDTFKDRRKEFFNNFVSMVSAFDKGISTKVDTIINRLDDNYVTAIDFVNEDADSEGLLKEILNNKAALYQTLFLGISYNRKDKSLILIILFLIAIILILVIF